MLRTPPLPPELWEQVPPAVQAALRVIIDGYERRVAALERAVAELKEQVRRPSQNSSKPPTSDGPHLKRKPPKEPSGRKPGGQPGHPIHRRAFFRSARSVTEVVPDRVTTDGHDSYPGAIQAELGDGVTHCTNRYLNNHLEQDHRGIKQRTHPMCGFKRFVLAERFCRVYEEVRHFFRTRSQRHESVLLAWQRALPLGRMRVLMATLAIA